MMHEVGRVEEGGREVESACPGSASSCSLGGWGGPAPQGGGRACRCERRAREPVAHLGPGAAQRRPALGGARRAGRSAAPRGGRLSRLEEAPARTSEGWRAGRGGWSAAAGRDRASWCAPAARAKTARPRGGAGPPGRADPAARLARQAAPPRPRPVGVHRRARGQDPQGPPPGRGPARRAPAQGRPPRTRDHNPLRRRPHATRPDGPLRVRSGALARNACEPSLKEGLVPALRTGALGGMDTLARHKGPTARQMSEDAGAPLLCRPPYRPDFNPLELACATRQARHRQAVERTGDGLGHTSGQISQTFSPHECKNSFNAAGYSPTGSDSALISQVGEQRRTDNDGISQALSP